MKKEENVLIFVSTSQYDKIRKDGCILIDARFRPMMWFRGSRRDSKLFTNEMYILESLPKEYKYIARDKYGALNIYTHKPKKEKKLGYWYICENKEHTFAKECIKNSLWCYNHLFKFIKWEDDKPYKIKELLNE